MANAKPVEVRLEPVDNQRLARLCFAKNEATLDAAIERLAKL